MRSLTTRRAPRLLALALAGGTVIAVAGTAGATAPARAHAAGGATTTGAAQSTVIAISLKTPLDQVLDSLLHLGSPITLNLVSASGNSINTDKTDANGRSDLASGTVADLPLLASVLKRSVVASMKTPVPAPQNLLSLPANPLGLQLTAAPQSAAVSPTTLTSVARTQLATSALGSLNSLGLGAVLDPAFAGLNSAAQGVLDALTPLSNALGSIPDVTIPSIPNVLQPLLGGPANLMNSTAIGGSTISGLVAALPQTLTDLENAIENGAVISLDGVDAQESIAPTASSTRSTAFGRLADLKLFGGLITVSGFGSTVSATATGTDPKKAGGSHAEADAQLVKASLDDGGSSLLGKTLVAVVDSKGLALQVLGSTGVSQSVQDLAAALNSAVGTLTTQLNNLLGMLGVTIQQSAVQHSETAMHAEAHASGVLVEVAPPSSGLDLKVRVGATDAESNYAAPAVTLPAPKAPAPGAKAPEKKLAYTGADLPLLGLAGLVLSGAAIVLRRRRAA
jgi:LPXTG-motif cell wall-anchored protein